MAWSPLQEIVTLDEAKLAAKLPLDVDTEDDDLIRRLLIAHESVFDYLTQRISDADEWEATVDTWTPETAPMRVKGAIVAEFVYTYRHRGDDANVGTTAPVCPEAKRLLDRFRDPAIA